MVKAEELGMGKDGKNEIVIKMNIYINNGVICSGPSLLNEGWEFVLLMESVPDRRIIL
jgi:hypothetical protein